MNLCFSIWESAHKEFLKRKPEMFEENFYFQNSWRWKGQSIDLYCKLKKISRLSSGNIRIFKIAIEFPGNWTKTFKIPRINCKKTYVDSLSRNSAGSSFAVNFIFPFFSVNSQFSTHEIGSNYISLESFSSSKIGDIQI